MDRLLSGFAPKTHLGFAYVELTETVRAMERRHLSGPVAGRVLGEALCVAALLGVNCSHEDERVAVNLHTDGPLSGLLVEASRNGALRGYTNEKTLDAFDGDPTATSADVLGAHGTMGVVQSTGDRVIYQGTVEVDPPDLRTALARYCNLSLQRPSAVAIHVRGGFEGVEMARALWMEKMPDGDTEAFIRVLEAFEDGRVEGALAKDEPLATWSELFGLPSLEPRETRPLRFGCSCNREKIIKVLGSLPPEELREIVEAGETQQVTCHFCGETYAVPPEGVAEILSRKTSSRN